MDEGVERAASFLVFGVGCARPAWGNLLDGELP